MVYEVTEKYTYNIGQEFGKDKASPINGVQKSKFRVAVHHRAKIDQIGTNKVCMGFQPTL
jgi:hypothetical protein